MVDFFGGFLTFTLFAGAVWGLVDLLIRIARQPVREDAGEWWVFSTYPFIPQEKPQRRN